MLIEVPEVLDQGRYTVAGRIGAGGMAIVHLAWDTEQARWCAVKFLAPEFLQKRKIRARFQTEAATMGQIDHPHVLRLFAAQMHGPAPYLLMELATCGSVEDWLVQYGAMPPTMAVEVAQQAALGLSEAHANGIVHRDMKPDNLLITADGSIKVTDFGIATELSRDSMTRTGSVMGTYAYMAPEQRSNAKAVDARSDVYGLAATVVAMLQGEANHEVMALSHEPTLRNHIPEPLWAVLEVALRYRPEERYAHAGEFAQALGGVLQAMPPMPEGVVPLNAYPMPLGPAPEKPRAPTFDGAPERVPASTQVQTNPRSPAAQAPIASSKWRFVATLLLLTLVGAAIATTLGSAGAAWFSAGPVRAAEAAYIDKAASLQQTVQQNTTVVSDLVTLGIDWETPMAQLDAMGGATGAARLQHALSFVAACEASVAEGPTDPNNPVFATAMEKVATLVAARDALVMERERWTQAASSSTGGLAVRVGLARSPEPLD